VKIPMNEIIALKATGRDRGTSSEFVMLHTWNEATPYVTHVAWWREEQQEWELAWGHYFENIDDARADFALRARDRVDRVGS
jgi:hypothetical protein